MSDFERRLETLSPKRRALYKLMLEEKRRPGAAPSIPR